MLPQPGTISGTVLLNDSTDHSGTLVRAFSDVGANFYNAVTAADGTYSLVGVAPGSYRVEFLHAGYGTRYWDGASDAATATLVDVTASGSTAGIDANLAPVVQPLSVFAFGATAYRGTSSPLFLFGSGFQYGVTGLAFSAGPGVTISIDSINSDSFVTATATVTSGAPLGSRNIVASRDDGQSATCTNCLNIADGFGSLSINLRTDTFSIVSGTVSMTRVDDPTQTTSQSALGLSAFFFNQPAGEYEVSALLSGYLPSTARVTIRPNQTTFLDLQLSRPKQPLAVSPAFQTPVYQGFDYEQTLFGSGFRDGGVTVAIDAGQGVQTAFTVFSDSQLVVRYIVAADATPGVRDVVITRDDGDTVTCVACIDLRAVVPGTVYGLTLSTGLNGSIAATVQFTSDSTGDVTVVESPGFFSLELPAGSYSMEATAPDHLTLTASLVVRPAENNFRNATLTMVRRALRVDGQTIPATQGSTTFAALTGAGFSVGVDTLTVDAGPGVQVVAGRLDDATLSVVVTVDANAQLGPRDLTVVRDGVESVVCNACLVIAPAPGAVTGTLLSESGGFVFGTVTATKVGDTVPTASTFAFFSYGLSLPPGDYILKFEAAGFFTEWYDDASSEATATPITVTSNGTSFASAVLRQQPNPLQLVFTTVGGIPQGQTLGGLAFGQGFQIGGVTGVSFSAGPDVAVSINSILSDGVADISVTAGDNAAPGFRDVTVTRDGGDSYTCVSCLLIERGAPVVDRVTTRKVKGVPTVTLTGKRLQTVTDVSSSSANVQVVGFTNNSNGTIAVRLKVKGDRKGIVTLTLTRDDGSTYTADVALRDT